MSGIQANEMVISAFHQNLPEVTSSLPVAKRKSSSVLISLNAQAANRQSASLPLLEMLSPLIS